MTMVTHLAMARDFTPWPTFMRRLPRGLRLRLFEVRDRTYVASYRCVAGKRLPAYFGPVGYDREAGWAGSWRGFEGFEIGALGFHGIVGWNKPGPSHWFWRRIPS